MSLSQIAVHYRRVSTSRTCSRSRVVPLSLLLGAFMAALTPSPGWALTSAAPAVHVLPFRVIDAAFSPSLGVIVAVSDSPNSLDLISPESGDVVSIPLPLAPSCVSVAPSGRFAAVGHNAWVSYVDLTTRAVTKTIPVSTDVIAVVLAGNGYIYAFPRHDQWVQVHCIQIASGAETLGHGLIYAGSVGKLAVSGTAIYIATRNLSPDNLEKHDISSGTSTFLYASPYWGDYPMCGDLWIADDGQRIFTACGNVFRSTADQASDMKYNGRLSELDSVQWASHSSTSGKIAVIPSSGPSYNPSTKGSDTTVQYYMYDYLTYDGNATLPAFPAGGTSFASHGRYVFQSADGSKQYVIVQAPDSSGLLNDYGVTTLSGPASGSGEEIYIPSAASAGGLGTTNWKTDLEVLNRTSESGTLKIEMLEVNQQNSTPRAVTVPLAPNQANRYTDILQTVFQYVGSASLRLTSSVIGLLVTSRTYNDQPTGTYGCSFPGIRAVDLVQSGQTGALFQLSHSSDMSVGYRTNLGLVNLSGDPTSVSVKFFKNSGELVGNTDYPLRAFEFRQQNGVFMEVATESLPEVFLTVQCETPACRILAFATVIDNRSGDPVCSVAR